MKPKQISQAIRAVGATQRQIAAQFGCCAHVNKIIHGEKRNTQIEHHICAILGKPWHEVFAGDPNDPREAAHNASGYRLAVRVARGGVIEATYLDDRLFRTRNDAIRAMYRLNRIEPDGAGNRVERKADVLPWFGPSTIHPKRSLGL